MFLVKVIEKKKETHGLTLPPGRRPRRGAVILERFS